MSKEYIIQITSGRGPAECCWVVSNVLKQLAKEAKNEKLVYTVLNREKGTEAGTLLSASIKISGANAEIFCTSWTGTILWIGKSPYRKFHKRKNWYVGVSYSCASNRIAINDKDITYHIFRSDGPGGQHVNKVSTAVRAVHLPTQTKVVVSETRSQCQNKKLAYLRLHKKLKDTVIQQVANEEKDMWDNHNSLERGNPIRIYAGIDFRIKNKRSCH
ncbi:MAG: peptide chain release factor H [Bacteroidales bacterium]|nr:peptide chain release factor H [Bacteroidales bacterium]